MCDHTHPATVSVKIMATDSISTPALDLLKTVVRRKIQLEEREKDNCSPQETVLDVLSRVTAIIQNFNSLLIGSDQYHRISCQSRHMMRGQDRLTQSDL